MTEEKKTPKLEILDNVKYQVEFQFDKPKTGTHTEYGPWFAYRVKHEGTEKTLFATTLLNAVLEAAKVRKGTTAVISLNQEPEEKKKKYWLVSANGELFDSRNIRASAPPKQKEQLHENPKLITPSIDDLVSTYWMLFDKMEARFGFTKLGKVVHNEKSSIPIELLIPEIFKATTSVFIESRRNGLVVAEGSVRDAVPDKKAGDPQDPFKDVPPPDDLPF